VYQRYFAGCKAGFQRADLVENAQITNLSLIFELLLKTTKQGFETAGNAQEASGYL
jgi:hypothetical protein